MSALSLDDLVPRDHPVRQIESALDFSFIYDLTRDLYSHSVGRPSIDSVVLFKLVSLQYLFGIRGMRQTVKESVWAKEAFPNLCVALGLTI